MSGWVEPNPIYDAWGRAGRPRCVHEHRTRVMDPIAGAMDTGDRRCTGCGATWYHTEPVPTPWPDAEPETEPKTEPGPAPEAEPGPEQSDARPAKPPA